MELLRDSDVSQESLRASLFNLESGIPIRAGPVNVPPVYSDDASTPTIEDRFLITHSPRRRDVFLLYRPTVSHYRLRSPGRLERSSREKHPASFPYSSVPLSTTIRYCRRLAIASISCIIRAELFSTVSLDASATTITQIPATVGYSNNVARR